MRSFFQNKGKILIKIETKVHMYCSTQFIKYLPILNTNFVRYYLFYICLHIGRCPSIISMVKYYNISNHKFQTTHDKYRLIRAKNLFVIGLNNDWNYVL